MIRARDLRLRRRSVLFFAGLLALGACQLPGGGEPPSLYTLTPKNTFSPDLPKVDWQLIVETPIAAAGLNTSRIALQRSPVTLEYYANANWTDIAPLMVQTLLIESFENSGKIVAVSRESTTLRADYLLKTELREFQAEYDGSGPPRARVRINAKLARMPDRAIIGSYTVERMERAQTGDLPAIALAFDEALGGAMRRVVEWSLTAPGSTTPPRR
jgi:cholesterol transport system auxiliary component